jgi:hypothetical protein
MDQALALRPADATRRGLRLRRAGLTFALIAGLSVLLAACGGSGGSSFTPRTGSSSPGAQSGAVAFAQCVRSRGVPEMPDPQNGRFQLPASLQNNPNFRPAVQACQHLLGPGGATNSGSGNSLLAFAHCMQTNGVPNFPDPPANGGGGFFGGSGIDPNSPQFQRAYQKCQSLLSGGQG